MNQEAKDLYNKVGVEKFWEIVTLESVKAEGYSSIEDYVQQRSSKEVAPLSEVQELKIDLEFSRFELWVVQDELDVTKQKLASVTIPASVLDITMFNTMMQQVNAINEKLEMKIDTKELAKEVLKEVLNPSKTEQKLSKAEQMKLDAAAKTSSDNLKLIQKQAKGNK